MADSFTRLRDQLVSLEDWLDDYLQSDLTKKERESATKLREYVEHCYRDERKWRSEKDAQDAIFRINAVWIKLYKPLLRKD
jgi:hypothetical protein